jgi:hypothetical protein
LSLTGGKALFGDTEIVDARTDVNEDVSACVVAIDSARGLRGGIGEGHRGAIYNRTARVGYDSGKGATVGGLCAEGSCAAKTKHGNDGKKQSHNNREDSVTYAHG